MNVQGYWRLAAAPTISVGKSVATLCSCFLPHLAAARSPVSLAASCPHGPLLPPPLGRRGFCWVRRIPPFPREVAATAAALVQEKKKHLAFTDSSLVEEELEGAKKSPVSFSLTVDHDKDDVASVDITACDGVANAHVDATSVDSTACDWVVNANVDPGSPCGTIRHPCNVNLDVADASGCPCDINDDILVAGEDGLGTDDITAIASVGASPQGSVQPLDAPPSAANLSDSALLSITASSLLRSTLTGQGFLASTDNEKTQPTRTEPARSPQLRRMLNSNHAIVKHQMDKKMQWFPYLDQFRVKDKVLTSTQIMQMLGSFMLQDRKDRITRVVANRTYAICPVVEGLLDLGNIAAVFRSADALGFQSVHVISNESDKRYKKNRKISMGSEKWLDAEIYNATTDCFQELRSRGYRVAVASITNDSIPIFDMDWTVPTAVVFGNEFRGVSMEALQLADFSCYIPMEGMVDSFNVSVAAGIVMHHAVIDRKARLGKHGDLSEEEQRILAADFYLRHSSRSLSVIDRMLQIKQEERQTNLRSVLMGDLEFDIELPEYLKVDLEKVSSEFISL